MACFLAISTLIIAHEPQSITPHGESINPSIQLNVSVGNAQQAPAHNTTVTSASQTIAQPVKAQPQEHIIIIKDERSLSKTIFHTIVAAGVGMAVTALSKSEKVAEIVSNVWSKLN